MTKTLYDPSFEHDACGVGMVADLSAAPTNATIVDALTILENLEHRGATGSDVDSGDGAGVLIQMPDDFLRAIFGDVVPAVGEYGIAHWMLPKTADVEQVRDVIDAVLAHVGLTSLGWRDVPVDSTILGPTSLASEPAFVQQLIAKDPADPAPDLERALYCARKVIEHTIDVYASSCSPNVLIYKGMLTAPQLRQYFNDLRDDRLTSAIAVVHSRFSTNVLPRWDLAQPFRYIAHNGEINTVRGQSELDDRARDVVGERRVAPADRRTDAAGHDGHERLGELRRGGRTPGAGRSIAAARRADDDPRGLGALDVHERVASRLLSLPRRAHGALGRSGLGDVL